MVDQGIRDYIDNIAAMTEMDTNGFVEWLRIMADYIDSMVYDGDFDASEVKPLCEWVDEFIYY